MNTYDFFDLVVDNGWMYFVSVIFVFCVYFILFRKYFISILDPLTYTFFFSAMAITVPVFLFLVDEIKTRIFTSFLSTQISFFIGFKLFSTIRIGALAKNGRKDQLGFQLKWTKWFFVVAGFSTVTLQLISYKLFGIPLFAESRLGIYGDSGGINNLLKRIIEVALQCYIFLTIFFINYKNKNFTFKVFTNFSVLIIAVFSILSGSKGAFVSFGLAFFIYALYAMRWGDKTIFNGIRKFSLRFGVVAVFLAVVVITLSESDSNPLFFLLLRIAQSGDVYYMAYPNEVIDNIPSSNWFISLFASPLSLLGIIPRSEVPYPLGFSLMEYHNPGVQFKGPNARMNVFAYVYFGIWFSPVYSFVIGAVLSFFRNKLFHLLPANIFGCILYFLLLSAALKIETDFHSSLADFLNIIVILPFFIFVSYLLSLSAKKSI